MLPLRYLFWGISIALFGYTAAHAGPADQPKPQVCSSVDECTKLVDTLKDPVGLAQALTDRCLAQLAASPMRRSTEDCDRAIAIDPYLVSAYDIRAQIQRIAFLSARDPVEKQRVATAVKGNLDKLVEIAPNEARSYLLRGDYFLYSAQDALALPDLNKAAALSPKEPLVYLLRSRAYKAAGDDDQAIRDGATFLAMAPPRADILVMMGEIHLKRANLGQALDLANQAAVAASNESKELNWGLNQALRLRGRIDLAMNEKVKAKEDFIAALASWPSDDIARKALEELLGKPIPAESECRSTAIMGSRQDALDAIGICTAVLDIFESSSALAERAMLYLHLKQFDLAAADYSRLINGDPKYLGYYRQRAIAYKSAGKLDLALADLNRALANGPETLILDNLDLLDRAEIEITLGKDEDAMKDVTDVLAKPPRSPRALALRAWIKVRLGKFDAAKEDLDAALSINPKLYETRIAKAQNALVRRSREEADSAFADLFRTE
ncbi:hypothetical protein [Rhizobium sp. LEGMi135b]